MRRLVSICALAALVLASGCVSTKTYESAMAEAEAERARVEAEMEETRGELTAEIGELNDRVDELTRQKEALEKLSAERAEEIAMLKNEAERISEQAGRITVEKEKELRSIRETYDDLVSEMEEEITRGDIKITRAVDKLSVNFVEKILFDSGRSEIKPEGLKVLKRVGDILKGVEERQIRVEGHTDDVPIGYRLKERFPSNWELSTARATTVVRYLQDSVGVDPSRLSAAGYSEYRPVETNDTADGRAQNRRIEIVLLPLDVDRVLEELKD